MTQTKTAGRRTPAARSNRMGAIRVTLALLNYGDEENVHRGLLADEDVRRCTVEALVDTGACELVLPGRVVKELGLRTLRRQPIRYADGRVAVRDVVGVVRVDVMGRTARVEAIVEPRKSYALLGQIPLEAMDLQADCRRQCLIPGHPESPDAPLREL